MDGKAIVWARVLGCLGAGLTGLLLWVALAFATGRVEWPLGWVFILLPLVSFFLALKWQLVGGALLALEGLVMTGWLGVGVIRVASTQIEGIAEIRFEWYLLVPLFIGLMLLASGVLFLVAGRRK